MSEEGPPERRQGCNSAFDAPRGPPKKCGKGRGAPGGVEGQSFFEKDNPGRVCGKVLFSGVSEATLKEEELLVAVGSGPLREGDNACAACSKGK